MDWMAAKAANRALNDREASAGATRLTSRPLFFWLSIAGPCNLECAHCGFRKHGRTSDQEMSDDTYAKIVDELFPAAYECKLGGENWGEMTISKRFHQVVRDAQRHNVSIHLTTNGTRMAPEWFDDLIETLNVIGFSMEGIGEEFEKIRGFKWRHFLANVEKVCRAREERGKRFRVEWRYCAHVDSIRQLPEMIRLARSLNVDRIQVMNLVPFLPEHRFKGLYYHRSLANQCFAEARAVARELNFDINIPRDFSTGSFGESQLIQVQRRSREAVRNESTPVPMPPRANGPEFLTCFRPWQGCSISELGEVRPCVVYWRPMGSLVGHSFEQVWNGRAYQNLRRRVNLRPDSLCYMCRLPKFDDPKNASERQLEPGRREMAINMLKSLVPRSAPRVTYRGIMDAEFAPQPPPA